MAPEQRRRGTKAKHVRAVTNDFGQHNPQTHLMPRLIEVALDKLESVKIFGGDYPLKTRGGLRISVDAVCYR
jgi:UDP-glucose 4-epimerase